MNDLQKAISEAKSVLVVLPQSASDKDYLAALQLQRAAPEKINLVAPEAKEVSWRAALGNPPQKKEFAISIDTTISPVDELRYEKENGTLTIFLSHSHPFNKQALRFADHLPKSDLIITIGFLTRSLAERAIEELPRNGATRHMWLEEYAENAGKEESPKLTSPSSIGLLGRLLVRSREDAGFHVLWSFITREDFVKTGSRPEEIPNLLRACSSIISLPRSVLVLWQFDENSGTAGFLWSADESFLARCGQELGKEIEDASVVKLPRYENFIEAETSLRKLLRALEAKPPLEAWLP